MAIVLPELRTAVQHYLDTHVHMEISAPTPDSGPTIQPNGSFTFNITVTNLDLALDPGIRLVNVRYHVKVQNPAVAKLVVPTTNPDFNGIRYKGPDTLVDLAPKAEVDEMYLLPPASGTGPIFIERAGDLDVGDSDIISVTGKCGPAAVGSTTVIACSIRADPDLDYLFPKNKESNTFSTTVLIS
jgi:hypothetical protein